MTKYTWTQHLQRVKEANDFISELKLDPDTNALYDLMHLLISKEGKDPVKWICQNKNLIARVSKYEYISAIPDDLYMQVKETVQHHIRSGEGSLIRVS